MFSIISEWCAHPQFHHSGAVVLWGLAWPVSRAAPLRLVAWPYVTSRTEGGDPEVFKQKQRLWAEGDGIWRDKEKTSLQVLFPLGVSWFLALAHAFAELFLKGLDRWYCGLRIGIGIRSPGVEPFVPQLCDWPRYPSPKNLSILTYQRKILDTVLPNTLSALICWFLWNSVLFI